MLLFNSNMVHFNSNALTRFIIKREHIIKQIVLAELNSIYVLIDSNTADSLI